MAAAAAAKAETGKLGAGGDKVPVHLPPITYEDPLHQDKKRVMESRNLSCIFQVPISCSAADTLKLLDQMIQAARVVHLDELELYFAGEDNGPFSARNELESLNLLFKIMDKLLLTSSDAAKEVLQMLQDEIVVRLRSVGKTDDAQMVSQTENHDAEDSLLKWGEHHGVKSKLRIACKPPYNLLITLFCAYVQCYPLKIESLSTFFVRPCIIKKISMYSRCHVLNQDIVELVELVADQKLSRKELERTLFTTLLCKVLVFQGAGRGMVAFENIGVGDTALEIPESLIISEELLSQSEVFIALKDFHNITSETMLLLWSMRERYNRTSKFKTYFETLPANFNTGLSFGIDALAALEGTLLFDEIMQAKQHLRQQYDDLFPLLCTNFPEIFRKDVCTWDNFLWACELWYSNSMMVVLSSGKLSTCLVPIAGLLNHSVSPHILKYGRVDEATKSLKFPLSRPCDAGEQCFLSYGKHPGSHLITFYGFLPRGDNPYDVIPLDLDTSVDEEDGTAQSVSTSQTSHMVRGTWLSRSGGFPTYGLPQPLLSHLRAALGCDLDESTTEVDIKENDRVVLETLLSIFNPMLEELAEPDESERESASWDVKLALVYKNLQRRIISSIVTSCTSALENA